MQNHIEREREENRETGEGREREENKKTGEGHLRMHERVPETGQEAQQHAEELFEGVEICSSPGRGP